MMKMNEKEHGRYIEKLARGRGKINCLTCELEEPDDPIFLYRRYNSEMNFISTLCRECYKRKETDWKDAGWIVADNEND